MLLASRTEKWWDSVMDVGLDPELTKWSVHSGPAVILTGKGYKEHHWLVVPPSTTSVISFLHHYYFSSSCRCLLAPFPVPRTSSVEAGLRFGFEDKLGTVPMPEGPSLPSCLMKRDIA